jgi:integrase
MTPLRHRVLFALHQHDRELDPQLQCRVKWGSSRFIVTMNTGYRIDRERWDADAQRCKPNSFHGARRVPAASINAEIARYASAVEDAFRAFAESGTYPTVPAMRADLQARLARQATVNPAADVLTAFDSFTSEQAAKNSWTDATITKMRVVRKHLERWKPTLSWKDFDEAGLASYVTYLRETRGQQNATIKKQLGYLRWFLAWAERKGYMVCRDFAHFRPKMKAGGKPVIYLTWDELMKVWDADLDGLYEDVRNVFVFCCFTSLRYSDAMNLRWSDVDRKTISITTVKTADPLVIDLNSWSEEILGRYVDEGYPDDRVFPSIPNQVMNRYLHRICKDCGIDSPVHVTWYKGAERHDEVHPKHELVTSHAGRRTFVVNALSMGIQPTVVMKWTGHSDYKAMKPYIAVSDASKAQAMALFDTKKDTEKA